MKKALLLSFATYLFLAPLALATVSPTPKLTSLCPPDNSGFANLCKISGGNIGIVIGTFIQLIFIVAILAALLYLIWGGLKWLMSGGDKSGVQAAREHIVAAVVGLVIIFLSYFILSIILTLFGLGGTLTNISIPQIPTLK